MYRVLQVVSALDVGGVERLLLNYCQRMGNSVQIDVVVFTDTKGMLESPFEAMGCTICHVPRIRKNFVGHLRELGDIIRSGNYDVVHSHQGYLGIVTLALAKKHSVKVRIAHAHLANRPETLLAKAFRRVVTPLNMLVATDLFACGRDAAIWAWGKKRCDSGKVRIVRNAIDTSLFAFNSEKRAILRRRLGLEDKLVVGNVARLSYQKNHTYLLRIFKKLREVRKDAVLLLIGDGELRDDIVSLARELKLEEYVRLLGARSDVHDLLNAMDVFVLPSHFEGLPVTLLEAQCNGLPCHVSDRITREAAVTDRVYYLPLKDTVNEWVVSILDSCSRSDYSTATSADRIRQVGYDIEHEAQKLEAFYVNRVQVAR